MIGGGIEEEDHSRDSKADLNREQDSSKSFDVKLELGNGSDSSLSSGVGSSLSTDPPAESIKTPTSRRCLGASNSSLSTSSIPLPTSEPEKKRRKKALPQLTCRYALVRFSTMF